MSDRFSENAAPLTGVPLALVTVIVDTFDVAVPLDINTVSKVGVAVRLRGGPV
jgi:hypothetical protein